jgi:hypothetical protein
MLGRLAISVVVWLAGLMFGTLLDGQSFTGSLRLIAAAVLGALPWVPLVSQPKGSRRRIAAITIVGMSVAVIVGLLLQLPTAYEHQRSFNARAAAGAQWLQAHPDFSYSKPSH